MGPKNIENQHDSQLALEGYAILRSGTLPASQHNSASVASSIPRRVVYIDSLRVLATLLLIYYHAAKVFDSRPSHLFNGIASSELEMFAGFVSVWHMPIFFLLAGAATYLALDARPGWRYVKERFQRLLIPFIFGVLVLVPPQVYFERISDPPYRPHPGGFSGSFLDFYPRFFEGMYPAGNFSLHHTWFILYLFVFSLGLLPVLLFIKRHHWGQRLVTALGDFLSKGPAILLLALPLAAVHMVLSDSYPRSPSLYGFWMNIFQYATLMVFGYLMMADVRLMQAAERNRRLASGLGLVLIAWLFFLLSRGDYASEADPSASFVASLNVWELLKTANYPFEWSLHALGEWFIIVGILGYGQRYLNSSSPLLRYATEVSYPAYLLHQTILIAIAYYIVQWELGIGAKFAILGTGTLVLTLLGCELAKQSPVTRLLVGLRLRRRQPGSLPMSSPAPGSQRWTIRKRLERA